MWGVSWATVMIHNTYWSLLDLLPMVLDQMHRSWKHSVRSRQKARWGNQSWDVKHRHLHLCTITFSYKTCIYIWPALGNYPQSGNQLRHHRLWLFSCTHSGIFSLLDALSPSVSDLNSDSISNTLYATVTSEPTHKLGSCLIPQASSCAHLLTNPVPHWNSLELDVDLDSYMGGPKTPIGPPVL